MGGDLLLVGRGESDSIRCLLAGVALALQVSLARRDLPAVGLVWRPLQGLGYWARATLWIGVAVGLCFALAAGVCALWGVEIKIPATPPSELRGALWRSCLYAPLLEEPIYRLQICVPLTVCVRPWGAIAVSGIVFGALHVVYGNPSPENLVGGWFLAWAFLKSGSMMVPVLLHSLGNLVAVAAQVGAWWWAVGG